MAKSKQKTSNLSKLASLLRPNSPKKTAVLFLLAFGIIGGGYMTMNSFAATNASILLPANKMIDLNTNKPATIITETTGGKKSAAVAYLGTVTVGTASPALETNDIYNTQFRIDNTGKQVKACVSVKAESGTGKLHLRLRGPSWTTGAPSESGYLYDAQVSSVQYQALCTVVGTMNFNGISNELALTIINAGNVPLHVAYGVADSN